jgi:hypothetical protein
MHCSQRCNQKKSILRSTVLGECTHSVFAKITIPKQYLPRIIDIIAKSIDCIKNKLFKTPRMLEDCLEDPF